MYLRYCTITGIDERTDIEQLLDLSIHYPFVEWGFLYSPKRAGNDPRYMSVEQINQVAHTLVCDHVAKDDPINLSLHVCGSGVDDYLDHYGPELREFPINLNLFDRVQLNFSDIEKTSFQLDDLVRAVAMSPQHIITQDTPNNWYVWRHLFRCSNHQLLCDRSGGTGNRIYDFDIPALGILYGFAGGIDPYEVDPVLQEMEDVLGEDIITWIDMESGVRTDNWLDLGKVERVLDTVSNHECVVV